jgi:glycosyltransferase involved in cell wall biosynthesis
LIRFEGIEGEIVTCGETDSHEEEGDQHVLVTPALKGVCVRTGVRASRGSAVVVLDADLPISDSDIKRLLSETRAHDVVLGSRLGSQATDRSRPLSRRIASRVFRLVVAWVFNLKGFDTQCGAKAFRSSAVKALFVSPVIDGLAYDLEVVLRARDLGMDIAHVPVAWVHYKSTISLWSAAPQMMTEMARLWLRRRASTIRADRQPNKALHPAAAGERQCVGPIR